VTASPRPDHDLESRLLLLLGRTSIAPKGFPVSSRAGESGLAPPGATNERAPEGIRSSLGREARIGTGRLSTGRYPPSVP